MSVKIRISYNTDKELQSLLQLLAPVMDDYKVSRNKEGQYKKAYVTIENIVDN